MALTHFKKAASSIVVICLASRRAYEPIKDAGIESFNTIACYPDKYTVESEV